MSGRLLASPETGTGRTKFLLLADHFFFPADQSLSFKTGDQPGFSSLIQWRSLPLKTKILLRMDGIFPPSISPGAPMLARAVLSRPDRYGTPGSFNYPAYLAAKSVYLQGWVKSESHILELRLNPSTLPVHLWLSIQAEKLRQRINTFLQERLPVTTAGLYMAILTGDRSMLSQAVQENFKKTGVMHILAISGIHMGLLALCCALVFTFLVKRSEHLLLRHHAKKLVCLLTMPVLLSYALIAGFNPPVVRALIMTTIFFLAILNDRQHHLPTHISIAALVILLVNPWLLYSASFQLSFGAVIGITAVLPRITSIVSSTKSSTTFFFSADHVINWVYSAFLVSAAACLATLPLLLYHFNRFSPISPVTTLLVEPLICFWSLIFGLISIPFIYVAPELAGLLVKIGSLGMKGADLITAVLAELPFADFRLTTPSPLEIGVYYLLLAALIRGRPHTWYRKPLIWLSVAILVLTPWYNKYRRAHQGCEKVSFLDVGQGSSAVLEMEGGEVVVIDGGGPYSERFNVGEAVIAPYLWKKRIDRIDQLVVSHLDGDHYNGLPFIIKQFKPEKVWLNDPVPGGSMVADNLMQAIREIGCTLIVPDQNEIISQSSISTLRNVADLHLGAGYPEDNNRSLVLKLSSNDHSFLFPGDIENKAGEQLLRRDLNLKADVLLAPHHGSITSGSEDFAEAVSPDCLVISAGKYRRKTFPAPEVTALYRALGSRIFNTASRGTIIFKVRKGGLEIETFTTDKQERVFNPAPDHLTDHHSTRL